MNERQHRKPVPPKYKPGKQYIKGTAKGKKSPMRQEDDIIRLNRFIAAAGICSRREADELIQAGLVSVNGKIVTEMGTKVKKQDDIRYNGERINRKNQYICF